MPIGADINFRGLRMANELAKEQFIKAESKMDEKYCGLLAKHEKDSVKLLICMYLVQTGVSLEMIELGIESFIRRGCFETAETFWRIDRLRKKSQSK